MSRQQLPLFNASSPAPSNAPRQQTPTSPVLTLPTPTPPPSLAEDERWVERTVEGIHLGYVLKRSRRKTVGLRVNENGLILTAPHWVTLKKLDEVLEQKLPWIGRKLEEWETRKQHLVLADAQWQDGGHIPFMGVQIQLSLAPALNKIEYSGHSHAPQAGDTLLLPLAHNASSTRIQDLTHAWLQEQARHHLDLRVQHFIAYNRGRPFTRWRLAGPAKRWGSCNSDGVIMLNWRLIHFPPAAIDYVVAHEVAHLKEMNHSDRFWQEVARLMPNYAEARQLLHQHSPGTLPLL